jgi:SAM-dependent methyltransferase
VNRQFARWQLLDAATVGGPRWRFIALQNASSYRDMAPLVARYARGRALDAGAGKLTWKPLFQRYVTGYVGADLVPAHPQLDLLLDVTLPLPFASSAFDTIFCISVLEHVREPWLTLAEMRRLLRVGGIAIVSVPFLFYLHGQPHDYWRFTQFGIRHLAEKSGFQVVEIVPNGGLAEFVLNLPSMFISSVLFSLRLTGLIPYSTRFWLALAQLVDRLFGTKAQFALNHIAVLRKALPD